MYGIIKTMDKDRLVFENRILDVLKDKIDSSLAEKERSSIFLNAYTSFCNGLKNQGPSAQKECFEDERSRDGFLKELQSYGIIDQFLDDPLVEDIIINGMQPIYIHHAKDGFKKTESQFSSPAELNLLIKKILVYNGRKELKKINDLMFYFFKIYDQEDNKEIMIQL